MNPIRQQVLDLLKSHAHHGKHVLAWDVKIHTRITDPNKDDQLPNWDVQQRCDWVLEEMWYRVSERDDASFSSAGRSDGWIVLVRFEGQAMNTGELELDESISNEWCRKLLQMVPTWDEAFKDPGKELQFQLDQRFEAELQEYQQEEKEKQYWEERDTVTT